MAQPYVLKNDLLDESVQIGNDIIPVIIDPTASAAQFQMLYVRLTNAQIKSRGELTPDELQALSKESGEIIVELMQLIFGSDGADKIIEFYRGNYTQMLFAIIPFIRDRLKPMLDSYVAEIHKSYKQATKRRW